MRDNPASEKSRPEAAEIFYFRESSRKIQNKTAEKLKTKLPKNSKQNSRKTQNKTAEFIKTGIAHFEWESSGSTGIDAAC